ncbi:MAG TPA: hypothetical protein VFD01_18035 [Candidatus Dormibacteraeota bacterium]|nr:hypothetical protein [Candidatus Dormibacteraeota bacterium]
MSGILVPCRRCGRQVDSSLVREGRCQDCRIEVALADLREEHRRLWRKRDRYRVRGAPTEAIGRQLARLEERMAARILDLVPDREAAAKQLERTLEQVRAERYEIRRPSR